MSDPRPVPGFTPCTRGQAACLAIIEAAGRDGAAWDDTWPLREGAVVAMVRPGWIFRDMGATRWRLAALGREMLAIWRLGKRVYSWELGRWIPEPEPVTANG